MGYIRPYIMTLINPSSANIAAGEISFGKVLRPTQKYRRGPKADQDLLQPRSTSPVSADDRCQQQVEGVWTRWREGVKVHIGLFHIRFRMAVEVGVAQVTGMADKPSAAVRLWCRRQKELQCPHLCRTPSNLRVVLYVPVHLALHPKDVRQTDRLR